MTFINMAAWWSMFTFLCCVFVNGEVNPENGSNNVETHAAEIAAVLNYLNSTPVKVYNYKHGTLINAVMKADITELTLHVSVDCLNKYPDLPCTEKILICNAFVRGNQVLNDVKCKPKPEIIIEEPPYIPSTNPTEANETKSIALSNEAVSSEVGDHFVAVRKDSMPCLGCPFDLNPNAEGVDELVNLALGHVETERANKQALVRVLKVQQQVVSGIKYVLLVEIAPTVCSKASTSNQESCPVDSKADTSVCHITYLHKPWINKAKHIISNNCTISQEFVKADMKKTDMNNEIDGNAGRTKFADTPNFDRIAESGVAEEMSPSRLEDLESQIFLEQDDVTTQPKQQSGNSHFVLPSTVQSEISAMENQPLEDRPTIYNTEESNIDRSEAEFPETTPLTSEQQVVNDFLAAYYGAADFTNFPRSLKSEEVTTQAKRLVEETTRPKRGNSLEENKNNSEESLEMTETSKSDEDFVEGKLRRKRAVPQLEKISPDEKGLVKNLADYVAAALDNIDDDNHKRIILQILGAKKRVGDDGVYYHLIMRMGVSRCLEDKSNPNENCREKLFENYTKICKVQVYVNDDFASPKIVKSQCQNIKRDENDSNRTNYGRFKRQTLVGGQTQIDKNSEKIRQFVREGVAHLNSQSNQKNKYKPVEVVSATSQVVSGISYRITTKLSLTDCLTTDNKDFDECGVLEGTSPKVCELKVWVKPWKSFKQTTITCEGDDKVYNFEARKRKRKRGIPGGQFEVSATDDSVIKYLEEGLTHLDSESPHENKFKVQEIISTTKQVVAGLNYRIKAKIVLSDCAKSSSTERGQCGSLEGGHAKSCYFKIYEKLSDDHETTIVCEGDNKEHKYSSESTGRRRKRAIFLGGESEVSSSDRFVEKYLEDGLKHLDSESPHENKLKVQEVVSVTKQVVAGHIYRIKAKIVLSDCSKTSSTGRGQCGTLEDALPKTCSFRVYEQLWVANSRETNITCEGDPKVHFFRAKRSVEEFRGDDVKVHFTVFNDFLRRYNVTYASKGEYKYRLKVFSDNMNFVKLLNAYEQGTATYGVTRFADMTRSEFSKSLGLRPDLRNENEPPFAEAEIPDVELPTEFDWRQKGAVSEVKNQEQCGSCWAFSVTGNVEGQYAIKHGKLLEFSEQELVDCDTEDQGCNGGLMDTAYRVIEKMGGLETEQDYPYDAEDEKCHFNKSLARVQLTGALNISHDETDMAKWLVGNGPISIAINANAMQFYMGGVSHPFKFLCNPKSLDHGVLIVGYGVHTYPLFKKSLPYWIVKNSWGKSWGEQGYYRVYRGDGTCGLNQTPSSAIVA